MEGLVFVPSHLENVVGNLCHCHVHLGCQMVPVLGSMVAVFDHSFKEDMEVAASSAAPEMAAGAGVVSACLLAALIRTRMDVYYH
jgi:hypothetical protein